MKSLSIKLDNTMWTFWEQNEGLEAIIKHKGKPRVYPAWFF